MVLDLAPSLLDETHVANVLDFGLVQAVQRLVVAFENSALLTSNHRP